MRAGLDKCQAGARELRASIVARIDEPIRAPISADEEAVLAANQAFYDAFEAADIDAMSALWERSARALCTHPGWATRRGWGPIAASWFALFRNQQHLQFIITRPEVVVQGDVGWVTLDENLLDSGAGGTGGTVSALNVFTRSSDGWRMVVHHGSPVVANS